MFSEFVQKGRWASLSVIDCLRSVCTHFSTSPNTSRMGEGGALSLSLTLFSRGSQLWPMALGYQLLLWSDVGCSRCHGESWWRGGSCCTNVQLFKTTHIHRHCSQPVRQACVCCYAGIVWRMTYKGPLLIPLHNLVAENEKCKAS